MLCNLVAFTCKRENVILRKTLFGDLVLQDRARMRLHRVSRRTVQDSYNRHFEVYNSFWFHGRPVLRFTLKHPETPQQLLSTFLNTAEPKGKALWNKKVALTMYGYLEYQWAFVFAQLSRSKREHKYWWIITVYACKIVTLVMDWKLTSTHRCVGFILNITWQKIRFVTGISYCFPWSSYWSCNDHVNNALMLVPHVRA